MVTDKISNRKRNSWSLVVSGVFTIYTLPAYAHGGADFAIGIILLWVLFPLLLLFVIILPIAYLIGKLFHLKKKLVVVYAVALTILIYLVALPNLQSIINWIVNLQYYFD
jgi:hypothetical protein